MNVKRIVAVAGILLAVAVGVLFVKDTMSGFVPATDTFTFERDLRSDFGRELDPKMLVSKEGMRLESLFSYNQKSFTPERTDRYGASNLEVRHGVGLTVNFVTKNGEADSVRTFQIKGWAMDEADGGNEVRRQLVSDKQAEFVEFIRNFTAPVKLSFTFGIVVDTTEGVDEALARRVREVVKATNAVSLAKAGNNVTMNFYHVTESSYQGGRRRVDLNGGLVEAENWLLSPAKEEKRSSVLRGLAAILTEMSKAGETPRLDIFTDGLENTEAVSVYKTPKLLEEANWAELDQVVALATLNLKGLEVHLHPLPPKNGRHEEMMTKGVAYLADRLKKAGATVVVEPI